MKKVPRLIETGAAGVAKVGAVSVVGIGVVGITMFTATSCTLGISLAKGMNMQNDHTLHLEVI